MVELSFLIGYINMLTSARARKSAGFKPVFASMFRRYPWKVIADYSAGRQGLWSWK
jgi:hypothetical protein